MSTKSRPRQIPFHATIEGTNLTKEDIAAFHNAMMEELAKVYVRKAIVRRIRKPVSRLERVLGRLARSIGKAPRNG